MINALPRNTRIYVPKPIFKGAESFNNRLERDNLFSQKDLLDFNLIRSPEDSQLLKSQAEQAKKSKKALESTVTATTQGAKLLEDRQRLQAPSEEEAVNSMKRTLEKEGLKVEPGANLEAMSKILRQYVAHNLDEKFGVNYGVGKDSDKAVKLLQELKQKPLCLKPNNSFLKRIFRWTQSFWQKIKSWLTLKTLAKRTTN